MRVLIAEDDRATARRLAGLTESWGYTVELAHDGGAALSAFGGEKAPDLAILDWMLPDLEGPEICRQIRQLGHTAATYLLLLTSKNSRSDVVAGLEAGADEYLVKPFDADELRARLNAGARIVALQRRLSEKVRELESALANIRKLSGLLPICAYCKSIRDDANYWHRVEEYVSEHADVRFSHGICPTCLPKAMLEMAADDNNSTRGDLGDAVI